MEEGGRRGSTAPAAWRRLEPPRHLGASRGERLAEQCGRGGQHSLGGQRGKPIADRAPVDERAPIGNQVEARHGHGATISECGALGKRRKRLRAMAIALCLGT